jgi:alanine-glyoxylate transaminase/serine-glyoxylate transaminase/serine-pyruvate transaminase
MSAAPPSFEPPVRLLLGPGPSPIDPRILQAFTRPTLGHLDPVFLKLMDEVRSMLRQVFRTRNELTFPVSGTGTAGMETCLVNLIEPGDEVVVLVQGYFGARMADIAGRCGGQVTVLNAPWGEGFEPPQVEAALRGKKPKVLAFVHAETSTGYRQDVPELAALGHKAGALVVVDAVTSTGGIPLLVDEWGIDAVYTGTQKCLGGPPGLAPVSFSPRAVEAIEKRKTKCHSWYLDMSLVRRYWGAERAYHHTAPINNVYGLHESLRIVLEEGLEARWKRHEEAHARFARGAQALGLEFQVAPGRRLPQLNAVRIPAGQDDKAGRKAMLEEHGIEIGGGLGELAGKIWRIGLMGYGARPEIVDQALKALNAVVGSKR